VISVHRWLPLIVCFTSLVAVAAGQAPQKKDKAAEPKAPAKLKNPTLKDVEKSPELYLGSRLTLDGLLGKATKPAGSMVELSVFHDGKSAVTWLRILAVKSLAEQLASLPDRQPVKFVGTVVAPESARANYGFELEEIHVLDTDGQVTTLKPAAVVLPKKKDVPPEPVVADKPKEKESVLPKAAAEEKKAGKVPTFLVVIAVALALFMVVSLVVGVRLIKHMKAQQKGGKKQPAPAEAVAVESDADDDE
jgi:hypothetical protein